MRSYILSPLLSGTPDLILIRGILLFQYDCMVSELQYAQNSVWLVGTVFGVFCIVLEYKNCVLVEEKYNIRYALCYLQSLS